MRNKLAALLLTLAALPAIAFAQKAELRIDPWGDGIYGGLSVAGWITTEYLITKPVPALPVAVDPSTINPLDALLVLPYGKTVSTVSDVGMIGAMAYPFTLLFVSAPEQWWKYGIVYAESLCTAITVKNILKLTIDRYRPYVYASGGNPPAELASDMTVSFPSGHTTVVFAAASSLATILATEYGDQPWSLPVALGGYAIAGTTGALRVAAGQHFITDVLTGAALGSGLGFLVTWLHYQAPAAVPLDEAGKSTMAAFATGETVGVRFSLP